MARIIILLMMLLPVSAVFAEAPAPSSRDESRAITIPDDQKRIVTSHGTVYVGMSLEKLYDIFQEQDRLFIPHSILSNEWHVFRDFTSKNPYDTITFYINAGKVTGWKREYASAPLNQGSKYEYFYNESIEVWFFPTDQAKWNGAKVTLLDWNRLTNGQKVMFILEYVREINNKFRSNVTVDIDKYILAMDHYADNSPIDNARIAASDAVNNLLITDGKAKEEPADK